jgi:hypothetical protein
MAKITRRNLFTFSALAPLATGLLAGASDREVSKAPRSPRERIRQRYFPTSFCARTRARKSGSMTT